MKMKNELLWTLLLAIVISNFIHAQGWELVYPNDPVGNAGDIIATADYVFEEEDGYRVYGYYYDEYTLTLTDEDGVVTSSTPVSFNGDIIIKDTDGGFVFGQNFFVAPPSGEDQSISKTDADGNLIWSYTFGDPDASERLNDLIQSADGNYVFTGMNSWGSQYSYIYKINAAGDILWKTEHSFSEDNIGNFSLVEMPDGGYLISGYKQVFNQGSLTVLLKVDANGNVEWSTELGEDLLARDLAIDNDSLIFWGQYDSDPTSNDPHVLRLVKTDLEGNVAWAKDYFNGTATNFAMAENGGYGLLYNDEFLVNTGEPNIGLIKTDEQGNVEWENKYGNAASEWTSDIKPTDDNGFVIAGTQFTTMAADSFGFAYVIKTDEAGVSLPNIIEGYLQYDTNENCINDIDEQGLEDWLVYAENEGGTYYVLTDSEGYYSVSVPAGEFDVSLIHPNEYWSACMDTVEVDIGNDFDTIQVDFAVQSVEQCPLMVVSMNAYSLILCEENLFYVECRNDGTVLAEDVYVEINFDDSLEVLDASVPYVLIEDNRYSFDVGDVDFLTEENFTVDVFAPCEEELAGQTLCSEALIFPDSTCLPIDSLWSGASIEAKALCDDGEVKLSLKNVGTATMQQQLEYIVVEDDVIMHSDFYGPLVVGDSIEYTNMADGTFYRIESPQEPNHPGLSTPSAFLEACGEGPNGEISLGFVNMYPLDDADPFVDMLCLEAQSAYDTNTKTGYPIGYDTPRYIERGVDIDYIIRFQNTGTAPANEVVIEDQISAHLDVLSVRPGVSSHVYDFDLLADGTLKFTFENINLPDSAMDLAGSIGFVTFKIAQQSDLPIGTEIFNEAAIFFDFNSPIITNQTLHTIGENFITVEVGEIFRPELSVNVYPNPFTEKTTIEIQYDDLIDSAVIQLFDLSGKIIRQEKFNGNKHEVERQGLSQGIYFYTIADNRGLINSGKLIVQ